MQILISIATTISQGSTELQKLDIETNQPLAGKVFKIVDEKGNTVLDNIEYCHQKTTAL